MTQHISTILASNALVRQKAGAAMARCDEEARSLSNDQERHRFWQLLSGWTDKRLADSENDRQQQR